MRGLFVVCVTCLVKGTQDRRGISCLIQDQADRDRFPDRQDQAGLRPGLLVTRSQCLVPVVLLLEALSLVAQAQ